MVTDGLVIEKALAEHELARALLLVDLHQQARPSIMQLRPLTHFHTVRSAWLPGASHRSQRPWLSHSASRLRRATPSR